MSNARNLADIVTGNFDVPLGALDNVPPSNDASALTTGTLPVGRLPSSGVDASSLTTGTLGTPRLPAGSVIQVVQTYFNTKVGLGGSAYVGLDVTITPSSTTSKIMLVGSIAFGRSNLNGSVKMLRNGSPFMPNIIGAYSGGASATLGGWNGADDGITGDGDYNISNQSFLYLDTPSSISALQYRLYYYQASGSGNGDLYVNRQRSDNGGTSCSVLIAMEIAG